MTNAFTGVSVAAARRALAAGLHAHQIDSPDLDARLLVGAVLGLDFTALIGASARILTGDESSRLQDFAQRRISGEPVARILGVREFWSLPLRLSADTLVPRPDTETIVEAALELLDGDHRRHDPLDIADLGTGSGAILLALLSELPNACGVGTDINVAALQTARQNARDLRFASRARFVACNYADALAGGWDVILSNPPYIRSADIAGLSIEVREHDPHRALDGGADGLDAYRTIAPDAARLLAPGGLLLVEVGHDQSGEVARLMEAAGLTLPGPPRADLAGIRRVVIGQKPIGQDGT
ncbi:peptide chain release factor N(5)-glutamine methyltransferase [Rhodopseudomonas sp. P2A-2r]|uniref:peptide chain release factor N(5)-glutamine methyltransferase n=1 Tax=unclassified Rhodopseudomonas TaxID=2638247 RepID=UPI0022342634|nr:peptide chain release factor N(5)-glutamine methyltransferase [Rhodopseudomonas sp. P2A-2r]UZE52026.1 peptide chain release factor N(5)-glutamine methyltransferase [Rhodopseudomonas sp. P2A-2r]